MKTWLLLFIFLVISFSFSVFAQDDSPKYKLRQLNAGDYLDGMPQTMLSPVDFDNNFE